MRVEGRGGFVSLVLLREISSQTMAILWLPDIVTLQSQKCRKITSNLLPTTHANPRLCA
jgi:hypothetical protein